MDALQVHQVPICSGNFWRFKITTKLLNITKTLALVAVAGGWSDWSVFSTCDKGCGGGKKHRHRFCKQPIPKHGGKDCVGNRLETKDCNEDSCPGCI